MWYLLVLLLLLIVGSGFFSGSETAMFNLRRHKSDDLNETVHGILNKPKEFLANILTGNTIMNVSIGVLSALIMHSLASQFAWNHMVVMFLDVVVVTAILLVFGEILPKIIAIRHSEKFANTVAIPLSIMLKMLSPIAWVMYGLTKAFLAVFNIKSERILDTEEELKILTDLSEKQGTIESDESDMIQSIFEFQKKIVSGIMTPRVDMVSIPDDSSFSDAFQNIAKNHYSKIPIYHKSVDNIVGILYAKDILPYIDQLDTKKIPRDLVREVFFVHENKDLDSLMTDFRAKKTNIAIVVDEWGGTSGLVTLEDVVEELIGEIRDPYDIEEMPFKKMPDGSVSVSGKMNIYDIEEEYGLRFPEDREYDTIGGYIFLTLSKVPQTGDCAKLDRLSFSVESMDKTRIEKVRISVESDPGDANSDAKESDEK